MHDALVAGSIVHARIRSVFCLEDRISRGVWDIQGFWIH